VAVAQDGSVYFATGGMNGNDGQDLFFRRITQDNRIEEVHGIALVKKIIAIDVGANGDLYFLIRGRLGVIHPQADFSTDTDGGVLTREETIIYTPSPIANPCDWLEGVHYTSGKLTTSATDMVVDRYGNIYLMFGYLDSSSSCSNVWGIKSITSTGIINPVAGNNSNACTTAAHGVDALDVSFHYPREIAVGPDGTLYSVEDRDSLTFTCPLGERFRKIVPKSRVQDGTVAIPDAGGGEVYSFDGGGRHVATKDPVTGKTLYTFGYDTDDSNFAEDGSLASACRFGNPNLCTTFEKNMSGNVVVTPPFGG
jgi:hypothetical protein